MQQSDRAMAQVAADDPLMIAWNEYKKSDQYSNTLGWAGKSNEGGLWAAFVEGFRRAQKDLSDAPAR